MDAEPKNKDQGIRVKNTPEFKLKDKPPKRRFQGINLKKQFGFVPEIIIVEKVWGRNNVILVRAVMTEEEIEKEEKIKKNLEATMIKKEKKEAEVKKK